jgi:dTDP-glucose pyrophosphorylase
MASFNGWKKSLILLSTSLEEVISNLNETCLQIALVVSPEGILLGTITDGDIRRGLLRGLGINSSIEEIVFRDPIVVPPEMGRAMVLQLMQANQVCQLPIVDEKRRVVGLHLLDELMVPPLRPNLMVIMAGGQGSRMLPYTKNCPKPLLKVEGKPILEHIIERARGDGFRHFVLATHYLGEMIEDYFGDGSRWQVKISYLQEESPLGTAGAISLLDPRPEAPLIVSNGDVLTDIHYGELLDFHCLHNASATMAVRLHELQHPFGVVRTNGVDIVGFEEKPVIRSHINAGVYALEPEALNALSVDEFCDMPTLFSRLQDGGTKTIVYPMHEPWIDVGRAKDLELANAKHSSKT